MSEPWLNIIGLGEDGPAGLSPATLGLIDRAEVIFGGPRHLSLIGAQSRGLPWPVPFEIAPVLAHRGRAVVVLASGDPFWFGAGSLLAEALAPGEWRAHPVPGTFALAAARLGWRLEETTCLGLHAAPFARLRPHLTRNARVLATLRDGAAVAELAGWLVAQGLGATRLTVLEALGGPRERLRGATAQGFDLNEVSAPVAVALDGADLPRGAGLPASPGLAERLFATDGQITKSPVRALTLAALAPRKGELLWDIGAGSGSISVEWCLAGGRAMALETRADRVANIEANIQNFGLTARMQVRQAHAPEGLDSLPPPDAVFVGGGGDEGLYTALLPLLPPGARLVANGVTLETEALLATLQARHGGSLLRIDLAQAAPLGRMRGWQSARPVVQWSYLA